MSTQPLTTEQIADLIPHYADLADLNADKRTRRPIDLALLCGDVLYSAGLLVRNPDGSLNGVLATAIANEGLPLEMREGLRRFLAGLSDPRIGNLDTTKPAIAEQTAQVLDACLDADLLTVDQVAAIYALGGGLLVPEEVGQQDWDDALAYNARREAANAATAAAYSYAESVARVAQAHVDDPAVELPEVPEPLADPVEGAA